MGLILFLLALWVVFGLIGFALHALWVVAVIAFVAWIVSMVFHKTSGKTNYGA